MRDIVQNHAMVFLTAMEPPVTFDAESVREEKVKVLKAVRPIPEDEVENYAVRGQYERGWVWGEEVPGYREEKNVDPGSVTETFVALKVFVDNWRWARVPFYIRAGKRLPKKATEVAIQFHASPHTPLRTTIPRASRRTCSSSESSQMRASPEDRGQSPWHRLRGQLGEHGPALRYGLPRRSPRCLPAASPRPDARRPNAVHPGRRGRSAWRILDPVMRHWSQKREVSFYPAGTWGPEEADAPRAGRQGSGGGRSGRRARPPAVEG